MKKTLLSLLALFCLASLAQAQTVKISTVDMNKVYSDYYKTKAAEEKIKSALDEARERTQSMIAEGQTLVEELKALNEEFQNAALTEEAKNAIRERALKKQDEIRKKEAEVQEFQRNTQQSLQGRSRTHRDLMLDEIKKVVMDVAKSRGSNLVLDTAGASSNAVPSVVYSDPAWDISAAVLAELNKDAPK